MPYSSGSGGRKAGQRSGAARREPIQINFGQPNPKQRLFFESRTLYTAYGGARGGGKSWAVRVKAVCGALRWPGIRILIVRRTYPELQQNHIEPVLRLLPPEAGTYSSSLRTVYFANGSVIRFGHGQSAVSMETEYQGQEYDWIFMDEATQFTEREFRTLGGCLRGVNSIPKRFYLTCNPGGVGHQWVKRLFIRRDFKTGSPVPEENENPGDYTFIPATVEDNAALLAASPSYLQMLSALPERLRRAHRYGDWDALGGAYFDEFSQARHVCPAFRIPPHWRRYRAFDYGLDMFSCCWIAVSPAGRCFVYREFDRSNMIVREAARAMVQNTLPGERITATFAPPDMWNRQKDTGRSMAEIFMACGVPIVRAGSDRVQGHLMIKELLSPGPDGEPGLSLFPCCRRLAEDLSAIQADENDPNDCARTPHGLTHSVDALRYFCVSRITSRPMDPAPEPDEGPERAAAEDYGEFMCGGAASPGYF